MDPHCPRDQHMRYLNRNTGMLSCYQRDCTCLECHLRLSPKEQQAWRGSK